MTGVLLDTHAAIWFVEGQLSAGAIDEIVLAGLAGNAFVSPVTAWEIGLLLRPRPPAAPRVVLSAPPGQWYAKLIGGPLLRETPLTAAILLESSALPDDIHADPADRMLIATARALDARLMTRDRKIHEYAALGHLQVVSC